MDSLTFLERAPKGKPQPLYVLHGDEDFLKRRVLEALGSFVLGKDGDEFSVSTHPGDKAAFATVYDELQTVPFFGSLYDVFVNAVARPSRVTGAKYNQVSSEFFNAVHEVLSKKAEAPDSLAALSKKLDRLSRGGRW